MVVNNPIPAKPDFVYADREEESVSEVSLLPREVPSPLGRRIPFMA
jgi:hypothetical protein